MKIIAETIDVNMVSFKSQLSQVSNIDLLSHFWLASLKTH